MESGREVQREEGIEGAVVGFAVWRDKQKYANKTKLKLNSFH